MSVLVNLTIRLSAAIGVLQLSGFYCVGQDLLIQNFYKQRICPVWIITTSVGPGDEGILVVRGCPSEAPLVLFYMQSVIQISTKVSLTVVSHL